MSLSNLGLDAFRTIAKLGTIVKAAVELGVTQTALTQRIKLLEQEVGHPLFLRSRRGMQLTEEGRVLLQYADERVRLESHALNRISGSGEEFPHRLHITGPTLQIRRRILSVLPQIKKKFPQAYFSFDIDDSHNLLQKLKELKTDIILSPWPVGNIQSKKLASSNFVLVGPHEWKGRKLDEMLKNESIIDFNAEDPYTVDFLKKFRIHPKLLKERHFINNTHQMLELVEAGLGYAVFDEKDVLPRIKNKKLMNLTPQYAMKADWFLCWNSQGDKLNPLMQELIELVM